ncbi:MAG: hypothetical protein MHM6MM_006790, partial [Cercozoa sp. M6MM]
MKHGSQVDDEWNGVEISVFEELNASLTTKATEEKSSVCAEVSSSSPNTEVGIDSAEATGMAVRISRCSCYCSSDETMDYLQEQLEELQVVEYDEKNEELRKRNIQLQELCTVICTNGAVPSCGNKKEI